MENTPERTILSRILSSLFKLFFLLLILAAFFWFGAKKNILMELKQAVNKNLIKEPAQAKLPIPENPHEFTYTWKYAGKSYSLSETLYESYFNFFAAQPKIYSYTSASLPTNWEEDYFNMFLAHFDGDNTISELAAKIREAGQKNNLSEDQTVELALAFVQSLTYDEIKAQNILANSSSANPDYPYEVLYKKTGVCSDKSFLAYLLVKELGYGTAIFVYENENHMSIGIQCPQDHSTYSSGYCYAETTSLGNKIGIIPELNTTNNSATSAKEFSHFNESGGGSTSFRTIGEAKIVDAVQGKTYFGIEQTLKTETSIENLKKFITAEQPLLESTRLTLTKDEQEIKSLRNQMEDLMKKEKFEEYNQLVPQYNGLVSDYQKNTKSFNNRVNTYNQKVNEYNKLIKDFYQI